MAALSTNPDENQASMFSKPKMYESAISTPRIIEVQKHVNMFIFSLSIVDNARLYVNKTNNAYKDVYLLMSEISM